MLISGDIMAPIENVNENTMIDNKALPTIEKKANVNEVLKLNLKNTPDIKKANKGFIPMEMSTRDVIEIGITICAGTSNISNFFWSGFRAYLSNISEIPKPEMMVDSVEFIDKIFDDIK